MKEEHSIKLNLPENSSATIITTEKGKVLELEIDKIFGYSIS